MSMEDSLDNLKTYFTAGLEAQLVTIETARSVTIPRWTDLDTGFVMSLQYPNISIVPASTAVDYGEAGTLVEPWYDDNISVLIEHKGSVQKDVQYVILRYVEALTALIIADYTCGNRVDITQIFAVDYSLIDAREAKSFRQVTDLQLLVREYRSN